MAGRLIGQCMILPFSNSLFHPLKAPCLSTVFLEGLSAVFLEEPDPGADCGGGGDKPG